LTRRVAPGVRFETSGERTAFQEFRLPSVLSRTSSRKGRLDLMSHGSFEIEPQTGRVLSAEFVADGPPGGYSVALAVRYDKDPKLDLSVPIEATERYWRADKTAEDHLEVHSTYTDFRRFQVSTGEQIKR